MFKWTQARDTKCTELARLVVRRYSLLGAKAQVGLVYLLARKVAVQTSSLVLDEWKEKLLEEMEV